MAKTSSKVVGCLMVIAAVAALAGCDDADRDTSIVHPPTAANTLVPTTTPTPTVLPGEANICDEFETVVAGKQVDTCAPQQTLSADLPQDVCNPIGAGWVPSQGSFDHLAWQTFVALNWPASTTQRGVADTTKTIGARATDGTLLPAVWETNKEVYEVFQYDDPSFMLTLDDWNDPQPVPSPCPQGARILRQTSKARPETQVEELGDDVNEAFHGPLVDQAGNLVRYEIRLNHTEFDQIVAGNYYLKNADVSSLVFLESEQDTAYGEGAIEVKAAWKQLSDAEWNARRYFAREVYIYNEAIGNTPATCTLQRMGLAGVHMIRKTSRAPEWYWATFEHVDNVPDPGAPPLPGAQYSFYNPNCTPAVSTTTCAQAKDSPNPADPAYQCCPNLQRYGPIGEGGDPYDLPRGPIQVTRLEPLTGGNGCDAAYKTALQGTVFENYRLVSTQWTMTQDGPPFMKIIMPAHLRNSVLETYMVGYTGTPPVQENQSSCIGCHTSGQDFSYIFEAADNQPPALGAP